MELKKAIDTLKFSLRDLWQQKVFRFAILINVFYLVISLVLTLTIFRNQNDFLVYYKVGEVFVNDINELYNRAKYLWPFRYLPISALFFVPFYLLGFNLGFIVFNLINFLLNILICVIIYQIILVIKKENHEKGNTRVVLYISLFLMSLPNIFNYILGQINLYITFLILLSLFLFLKYHSLKSDFISSVILGISIIIKPITIFMIPFLLVINFNYKTRKFENSLLRSAIRIIGVTLPLSLNIFFFLLYPPLLEGFLTTNFTGNEPIILNHSFSLSKLIINFCIFYNITYNGLVILIILFSFFGILGFIIYIFRRTSEYSIIHGYVLGIVTMLLVYFDSWPHHLLILTPLLIILIFLIPRNSKNTKRYIKLSLFFFSFFDLLFMGIWFLTEDYFPFNFISTIFLILIFFSIMKIYLFKNSNIQKN